MLVERCGGNEKCWRRMPGGRWLPRFGSTGTNSARIPPIGLHEAEENPPPKIYVNDSLFFSIRSSFFHYIAVRSLHPVVLTFVLSPKCPCQLKRPKHPARAFLVHFLIRRAMSSSNSE